MSLNISGIELKKYINKINARGNNNNNNQSF